MFTGLIETVGRVVELSSAKGSKRLGITSTLPVEGTEPGASVAVDGVCLTVSSRRGDRIVADVIDETLRCSTLGALRPGSRVHLERSLRVGDHLGGHWVQGHVDVAVGVLAVRRGADYRLRLELPREVRRLVAYKGSIALHGVSLTVSDVDETSFSVALVPETLLRTTLGTLRPGDRVNVEVDLLARYLDRLQGDARMPQGDAPREPEATDQP